jgi:hypothetical protein
MPNKLRSCRIVAAFRTLARINAKQTITVAATLLIALTCLAQDRPAHGSMNNDRPQTTLPDSPTSSQASAETQPSVVIIPSGTRFALVLTNSISSKTTHRGDEIYAQTTAPVAVGDQVLIPAGTFVQGKVDRLVRNGNHAEMLMRSASVIFPGGYVAKIAGPLSVESGEETAWRDPSDGAKAGAILAPMAGGGLGALIGSQIHTTQSSTLGGTTLTSSTPKGLAIGSMVGLGIGGAISLAILLHSRGFFVDVGSPMEMTLPQPLTLSGNQVADAARWAREHPVAVPMPAPRPLPYPPSLDHGMCFTPGTPGTPPTFIPGTPPVGNSPGTPGTVIPGTPPTPGTPYPCP